ncbi:MAG: N-6 DNA methylase [Gemmatimonadetes bacterium]|nr:N-6 DNA methylase [Gemmatimonadota bacterium]MYB58226.1 N-6 DNA methylase [Gemmatimonadota bacterium]
MPQLEHIEKIERRLWGAADTLRANSNYASNEYFLPVMGLVFLRYAYSRYLSIKDRIEANLPTRGGKKRALTKEDFSQKNAIYLRPNAQFDHLVALPDSEDRIKAVIEAMDSIEDDYESLRGALPKSEYQELDNDVLGQLLRTLNPDELKQVSGDVFGRIYEYFLTQFADEKAHDDGEFFTPVSLVSLIAHVLEPDCGTVLDPACGSGGMFVQSARTVEEQGQHPTEQLTFRGIEKNGTTIRLARMNLAVHGLEGDIRQAITYYEDPHELLGKADYVMANPPFNVDEIDADKVKTDPRLPFGLPGVNKENKVSSGNYVWISYFYSYLNETGRAGFVMSSQASSAGSSEAEVRRKLVETGDVEAMIAIRSNFFYTRTVPCELWFLNRAKPETHRDKVLMIDARNIYRQVTRKIYDFSPEQQQNILAIVHLYRGETERFLDLTSNYLQRILEESRACFEINDGETIHPLPDFVNALTQLHDLLAPSLKTLPKNGQHAETRAEYDKARTSLPEAIEQFRTAITETAPNTSTDLNKQVAEFAPLIEISRNLSERTESLYKLAIRITDICETVGTTNNRSDITRARRTADEARKVAVEQLKQINYFYQQARWLTERFPEAKLCDVEGLVKLVDRAEIEANDWSLTPGRYVGVAPEEEDENFDFAETLREIHEELDELNGEAVSLAATIKRNFEALIPGITA